MSLPPKGPRHAATSGRLSALLAACVSAMAVLMVGWLWSRMSGGGELADPASEPRARDGEVVRAADLQCGAECSRPLGDPNRIRRMLKPGQTYLMHTKGALVARAVDLERGGPGQTVNLAHAFETLVARTIESNDGRRIVEVRDFQRVWAVTVLCEREPLEIELGPPARPLLERLEDVRSHVGTRRVAVKPVGEAILRGGAEAVAADPASKAFWEVDSLSGKKVRVTYVDGIGVESLQPLGCHLSNPDCLFLCSLPVLWDAHLLPGTNARPDDARSVDASQLSGLMPPSMFLMPGGRLAIERHPDGGQCVRLEIRSIGPWQPAQELFWPEGTLQYDAGEGLVRRAILPCRVRSNYLEQLYPSGTHRIPSVALCGEPTLTLIYSCEIRPITPPGRPGDKQGSAHARASRPAQLAEEGSDPRLAVAGVIWGQQPAWWRAWGDLTLGVLLILVLSLVLFRCGMRVAGRLSRTASAWIGLAVAAFILLFATFIHGTLLVAKTLPLSGAIVVGNWIPLGAALLAGIAGGDRSAPPWRRAVFASLLISLGYCTVLRDFVLLAPSEPSENLFLNDVCLQTSSVSCSACCAVTLLGCCGIQSNEREMTELCLTNKKGTPLLGVYRGLKLKTRDTPWDVEVVRCGLDQLRQSHSWPVLLRVRLGSTRTLGDAARPGSLPGTEHTLLLFGFTSDDRVEIGDPSNYAVGRCRWTVDELRQCWLGEGLRLVGRSSPRRVARDIVTTPKAADGG